MKKTPLKNINETRIIENITLGLKQDKSFVKHIGDDAAVIKVASGRLLLFASDMLVERTHFDLKTASWYDVGRKAVARNISDIAAMGGTPKYITVSLGLPKKHCFEDVKRLYKGIRETADKYNVFIAGGDVCACRHLIVNIAIIGLVKKRELVCRDNAGVGDFIFVTGALGGSITKKHLKFTPRLKEALYLVRNFKPSAMIDLSDGLAEDLGRLIRQSNVGARLDAKSIPLSREARDVSSALYDGEDFELLFTLSKQKAPKLLKYRRHLFGLKISHIGFIVDRKEGFCFLDKFEKKHKINPKGNYRHFK